MVFTHPFENADTVAIVSCIVVCMGDLEKRASGFRVVSVVGIDAQVAGGVDVLDGVGLAEILDGGEVLGRRGSVVIVLFIVFVFVVSVAGGAG